MGKCNFRVAINLVIKKDDKICLMRRFNTGWNDGMYALMGGHVNDGESPVDAVIREAREELGIIVDEINLKHLLTMSVNPDHIYLYFMVDKFKGKIENMEPDQCDEISFFDVDKIPENVIEADKKALNIIFSNKKTNYASFGYEKE